MRDLNSYRVTCLFVSAALALSGCGDAGPSEPGEAVAHAISAITPTPETAFANDEPAFDYFLGKGLTDFQAAGIVGNLDQESGVDPNAVQQGGPGRGIAQWSVGGRWDTDSNDNCTWYASQQGQSVWSLQLQLDFIWYELTTFPSYGLSDLRGTTNVTDATVTFETDFEGCGECDQSTRISYAESVLAAYGAAPYGAQFVSQSFPLATTTLTMVEGQVIPSYIELKNIGTKSWDSSTRIGTTEPRDRDSVFTDKTWISANRPAAAKGTVAPGGTYKFTFDLAAPMMTGTYEEYFGVVEDGVAWFSDPGQGGPPDNDLEVKIQVVEPDYRGTFKDQSFPLSPTALTVHVGDVVTGTISLTNTGTKTWIAGTTKLAPIPRDQPSPFADKSWLSPTRISSVAANVAPGDVGTFDVSLDAASVGDTEVEFGLVEEGVTWFADATLGGGPPDGFLRVHLVVVPEGTAVDAGASSDDGSAGTDDAGEGRATPEGIDAGDAGAGWPTATGGQSGGCAIAPASEAVSSWMTATGLLLIAGGAVRRRRR
jgi:hypothetical protein